MGIQDSCKVDNAAIQESCIIYLGRMRDSFI